jgi:multiple sugar transport system substrate-binding protein
MRLSATDRAILAAFCRQYIEGERFPSPAPNNRILEELAGHGVFLDLDTLRGHLRSLYAKFGLEEGLTPGEKRVRLVECVYDHGLIPGWRAGPSDPTSSSDDATASAGEPAIDEEPTTERLRSTSTRLQSFLRGRPWAAAGGVAVVIGLLVVALAEPWSSGGDPADQPVVTRSAISDATGTVSYCTGSDVVTSKDGGTRQHAQAVEDFNRAFGPKLRAKLYELPEEAGQQYKRFSRDQRERTGLCDVFYSDVTWTADFAHNNWLLDLTPYFKQRLSSFVDAMRAAAVFEGKMYGVPKQADAALLYYRTDHVKDVPETWQDLYRQAAAGPTERLRYQGLDYEGLTVNFLEMAYAAGADEIVTPDRQANLKNQVPAYVALELMVEGMRTHAAPYGVVNHKEEESLRAFGRGSADFLRHWPYAYAALQDRTRYPNIAGRVGVAPLPTWNGRPAASVLGGHVLVVSAFSKQPAAALRLVEYLTSRKIIKRDATEFSLAPTIIDLWDDPDVQAELPAFEDLRDAVFNARSRPVTPNYEAVSAAISENVNRALRDQIPPDEALEAAHADMQQALDQAYGTDP